ncbi:MAG: PD40 domain-containing protein [Flammeovirgaceae bacterium]|nr:MAG: PD40 domain-containing protein [Flammeovirgaceae bacterium]
MLRVFSTILIIVILGLFSCENDDNLIFPKCPPYDIVPTSPYDDPIWHPNGQLIGFNHRPIKEIQYTNGYECPRQAIYIYKEDSVGFWLINSDGTGKRRALPFFLHNPDWSPDGNWIAFMNGAQIFKMPFDGANFDTTAIEQLTFEGRNFFPAWSPDGEFIAYDNTNCGSASTPIPPNSCGVLIMGADGSNKRFVGKGRVPYWRDDSNYLFTYGTRYNIHQATSEIFFDPKENNISFYPRVRFNPQGTKIAFIGNYTNTSTQFAKLFTITPDGSDLKTVSNNNIMNFSWAPDGRIVYLNFDYMRIDNEKGTLWIMDANGKNQFQLTRNNFIMSY